MDTIVDETMPFKFYFQFYIEHTRQHRKRVYMRFILNHHFNHGTTGLKHVLILFKADHLFHIFYGSVTYWGHMA